MENMELIFHKSKKYSEEDIFYYISDQRDKHSMIKPKKENLISMSVDSENLSIPNKKEITNVFYPFKKNSVNKIYIGLSFPLFSNNWAASYLRYLLKIIKKDGSIILPVYPEGQANEKGMWSRSFLENIFTSRTGWTGRNNVWAENDGVMSMRIGKKFPKKPNSTLNFYLEETGGQYFQNNFENKENSNLKIIKNIWSTSKFSSIVEKIIQDNCQNKKIIYSDIGENPSLAFEVSVSNYTKVTKTVICTSNNQSYDDLDNYFSYRISNEFLKLDSLDINNLVINKPNVISIIYNKNNLEILKKLLKLTSKSILIFYGILDKNDSLFNNYNIAIYSSIVATRIDSNKIINHYSDIIEDEINNEKNNNLDKIYVLVPK